MEIKDIRTMVKMTQREFSSHFGIPIGTLRNWEQGIAQPPSYVFQMIFEIIRRDKMINIETLKLYKIIDILADLSKNGIESFSTATRSTFHDRVYYNDKLPDENGNFRVVLDACIDPEHHDACSYYDSVSEGYTIRVVLPESDEDSPYILVKFLISEDEIIIENGNWYFTVLFS